MNFNANYHRRVLIKKTLLFMKMTTFLLLSTCLAASAGGFAQRVTLSANNVKIEKIFKEIKKQTGYVFFYEAHVLQETKRVSIHVKNETVGEVLKEILQGEPVDFSILQKTVTIVKKKNQYVTTSSVTPLSQLAEDIPPVPVNIINGTVKDAQGNPLAGVSVIVKGTNKGTSTGTNGSFSIDANIGDVLEFTMIGYQKKSVTVGKQTEINVRLELDVSGLSDVVVVGYGTQKKVNLTGSVSEIDFNNEITNRPITNTSQALSGKVPGLWVSQNGGRPGEDNALLRIRGWGSFNGSGPLVIIDGTEGSIDRLNPQDIKSVSVLKDAASASIYGSKAANGVILVVTKTGDFNKKPQINLSSYYGIQSIGLHYDMITNSATWMELYNQARINSGQTAVFPENVISDFRNNSDPYLYPNTDFNDVMFRKAPLLNNNLSISGGSKNSKYYISFNYQDQDGILIGTKSKKFELTMNLESKVNDWISIGGRISTRNKVTDGPFDSERVSYIWSNGAYPVIAAYNKDGTPGGVQALDKNGNQLIANRNPVLEALNGNTNDNGFLTRWAGYGDFRLLDGLLLKTNLTVQVTSSVTDRYNAGKVTGVLSNGKLAPNLDAASFDYFQAFRNNSTSVSYIWFNTLNYTKKINKHDISVLAGMQMEDFTTKSASAHSILQPAAGITEVSAGTSGVKAGGNWDGNRMLSYFGRANYEFNDKYLFEFNVRADGSSRFAENKRWGTFPGVSVGWRIGKEDFMSHQNIFSNLKIRASSGKLGNQNIAGNWPYLSTLAQSYALSYSFGGTISPGAAITTLVNAGLTWETTTINEIGVEMYFLENRLGFEATVFNKKTDGIIVRLPLPNTIGTSGDPYENIGKMVNNGVETELTYSNKVSDRNKFKYTLTANFTYIVNEVTKFMGDKSPDQIYLIREGVSYKSLYGYNKIGIFQTDKEAKDYMYANGVTPKAGDIKFEDRNGDGKLDYRDQKVLGNTIPKINFGATLGFSYYGFNLDVLIQGISGVTVNTRDRWNMPLGASGGMIPVRWLNAWSPENPNSDLPIMKLNDAWNLRRVSNFWADDLTYLKIRNIQFGYTFPKDLLKNIDLNIYCNLQNYFTFTDKGWAGFDPERNVFLISSSPNERELSDFYPMPKTITAGINVIF